MTDTSLRTLRSLILAILFVTPVLSRANVAPPAGQLTGAEVKRQLSAYFGNIAQNSPTVLGGLAKSPEAMAQVQRRIASMSEQELAPFQKLMTEAPDWKVAPEALAGAFPPEMLEQMRRVGADYAARVPQGSEMRDDVGTLVSVLKLLPDAKLEELGINREMISSLETTFTEISPLQAAMLHRKAGESAPWDATSAAAIHEIPPALRRGAAALAKHGPLTDKDVAGLNGFRRELIGLFDRIDKLPAETRKSLNADRLRVQVQQLGQASPDMLFMVRHNVPEEMLGSLEENVAFLERIANMSDGEKEGLEKFRGDLTSAFKSLDDNQEATEGKKSIKEMLAGLQPEHLMVLKDGMSTFGNWQTALPVVYQTLASPELADRLKLLQGATPDPAVVQSLTDFRRQTLADIEEVAATDGWDANTIENARKGVDAAPLQRLEVMRMSVENMPESASKADKLTVVLMSEINFNCSIDMPSPVPDISIDFICDPIEDALEAIRDGIVGTVNTIVNGVKSALETTISSVSTFLTNAVNTVTATVNSLVDAITSTANNIWAFIQTVPAKAWTAIQAALNLLLDIEIKNGVTIRMLVAQGAQTALTSMKTLVGLADGWWTAVSNFTLPQIPCPAPGFNTPFGVVGEGSAAMNYGRYRLLIDGIVGLIPDTETSLAIKIPAQILYMGYDFLGLCLEQAASKADKELAGTRHTLILTNFTNLQTYIGTQIGALSTASGNQSTQLKTTINSQTTNIQTTVVNQSVAVQNALNTQSTTIQNLVRSKSTEIRSLVQNENDSTQADVAAFQKLNLRLFIEQTLRAGEGHELALLQLLEPLGYLRLVGDIVNETINAMNATRQMKGDASKDYLKAQGYMNAGKEKDAFKYFIRAYKTAVSSEGDDD